MRDDEVELPVPDGETAMEDAGEYDGEDHDDIYEVAVEPDQNVPPDEDDTENQVAMEDFDLKPPPDDLVADDVDE